MLTYTYMYVAIYLWMLISLEKKKKINLKAIYFICHGRTHLCSRLWEVKDAVSVKGYCIIYSLLFPYIENEKAKEKLSSVHIFCIWFLPLWFQKVPWFEVGNFIISSTLISLNFFLRFNQSTLLSSFNIYSWCFKICWSQHWVFWSEGDCKIFQPRCYENDIKKTC